MSEVVRVNNITFSPIKAERLDQIRAASQKDVTLTLLKNTIMEGWPADKALVMQELIPYYNYRDELTVQDGIILRGDRIVIPTAMRKEMKQKLHSGHLGINSSLRRARDLIFWPGMSNDIRQYIETCDTCASQCNKQPPETLYLHDVPNRPWEKVGSDLFTIENRNYLVTVDYYSNFFEVDFLSETTSEAVINKLKHHFARHGIPDIVISDNGPQFNSERFKNFSNNWSFKHEPISPGNSKANGAAEAAVKIAKRLMKKCKNAGEDPYIALLNLRNTPTEGLDTSPTQRLMSRRTKTILPTLSNKLKPNSQNIYSEKIVMENKRAKVANYHDRARKDLKPLNTGDNVRLQPIQPGKAKWEQATVKRKLKSRTYEVQTDDGRSFRRNRQFLRATKKSREPIVDHPVTNLPNFSSSQRIDSKRYENPCPINLHNFDKHPGPTNIHSFDDVHDVPTDVQPAPPPPRNVPYCTRAGRVIKKLDKLNL